MPRTRAQLDSHAIKMHLRVLEGSVLHYNPTCCLELAQQYGHKPRRADSHIQTVLYQQQRLVHVALIGHLAGTSQTML